ncbi:MAG: type II secretion system F family protein [Candidatus Omnitrophica bacterium]|nr:type II secretion system F family protein [Candidatus Omnitrophota bacterium]
MTQFSYTAKVGPQEIIQGLIDAESQQEAIKTLSNQGCFPLSLKVANLSAQDKGLLRIRKISMAEVALFTNQLAGLLGSGVILLRALNILSSQTVNQHFKSVIDDISDKIKDGKSLSEGFSMYPELFSNLYVAMVHSGEMSGKLDQTLKRLAEFLEKDQEFKSSVRSALIYPAFVFSVGVATVVLLLTFVIPRLVGMFEDMGQALPLPTRILIGVSEFWRQSWPVMLALLVIFFFVFNRWRHTLEGKRDWDRFQLKLPLVGEIILKTEIARLSQTLSLLISSGMEILHSLDISASVVDNEIIKNELKSSREKIRMGASLSTCLIDSKMFPSLVTSVIAVGEETGTVDKSFLRIADEYEARVEKMLKTLTQLLEPVIILVMGVVVGFIVMSMLLPIFQINMIMK